MNAIIFIMGVAGSGKTTIGNLLFKKTGIPFFDADDFHSNYNKEKMKAGRALNDDDRAEWLQKLNKLALEHSKLSGAIVACSSLKEKYRTMLAADIQHSIWIFLHGSFDTIKKRMEKRKHFMPIGLLQSQFDDLEIPKYAYTIDIQKEQSKMVDEIMQHISVKEKA